MLMMNTQTGLIKNMTGRLSNVEKRLGASSAQLTSMDSRTQNLHQQNLENHQLLHEIKCQTARAHATVRALDDNASTIATMQEKFQAKGGEPLLIQAASRRAPYWSHPFARVSSAPTTARVSSAPTSAPTSARVSSAPTSSRVSSAPTSARVSSAPTSAPTVFGCSCRSPDFFCPYLCLLCV
jgi:hypothetical protein